MLEHLLILDRARVVHRVVLHEEQVRLVHPDLDAVRVECLDVRRIGHRRHRQQEVRNALGVEDALVALLDLLRRDRRAVVVFQALAQGELEVRVVRRE